jgi:acyl-CoA thioesterase-1
MIKPTGLTFLCALALGMLALAPVTPAQPAVETIRLVVLGDSLSAGFDLPPGLGFIDQLEAALKERGHAVDVVDAAVSGDTASAGLARLDWVVDETVDAAIVELGANDMLRGIDPAVTEAALGSILDRLQERGIPVLLAGMRAAPNLGPEYQARFDRIYPAVAERQGALLYPFFLEGVAANAALNLGDGMHPNADGVGVIVPGILPLVEELMAKAKLATAVP